MVDEVPRRVFGKATEPKPRRPANLNQFSYPADRIFTSSICVGTQFPHAVGLALAAKIRNESHLTYVFGGDASTSPGDWHEAMNFASVHRLPVVFVIENNTIAISTTLEQQMAVANVADRAAAYAMPGFIGDGMDVLDSYEKTRAAAAHAAAGGGPALVELKCYRYQPHTSDDETRSTARRRRSPRGRRRTDRPLAGVPPRERCLRQAPGDERRARRRDRAGDRAGRG